MNGDNTRRTRAEEDRRKGEGGGEEGGKEQMTVFNVFCHFEWILFNFVFSPFFFCIGQQPFKLIVPKLPFFLFVWRTCVPHTQQCSPYRCFVCVFTGRLSAAGYCISVAPFVVLWQWPRKYDVSAMTKRMALNIIRRSQCGSRLGCSSRQCPWEMIVMRLELATYSVCAACDLPLHFNSILIPWKYDCGRLSVKCMTLKLCAHCAYNIKT